MDPRLPRLDDSLLPEDSPYEILCELLDIELDPARHAYLEALDLGGMEQLRLALKRERRWPGPDQA